MGTQLLLTIPHGIEYCPLTKRWVPSGLYHQVKVPEDPEDKIEQTHIVDTSLHWDAPDAYLGGGIAVLHALSRMHHLESRFAHADIGIIGGRPVSVQKMSGDIPKDITEASVMSAYLTDEYRIETTHIVTTTRTPDDEIAAILQLAEAYGDVYVITMDHRLFQGRLLLRDHIKRHPAKAVVAKRVLYHGALQYLPDYVPDLTQIYQSAAYRLTMEYEHRALVQLNRA